MPFKPHLDLKILQCNHDVGGADAWLGGYWDARSQWYTGWHQPGHTGLQGLIEWTWPSDNWSLIGFERWEFCRRGDILVEAYYNDPNGERKSSRWSPGALWEEELYLKGGITGPKGGKGKGKGQGSSLPKGGKGKGKGQGSSLPKGGKDSGKGKAKGEGKCQGKAKGKDSGKGITD